MEDIKLNKKYLSDEEKWGVIIGFQYNNQTYDQLMETFNNNSKGTISKIIDKYHIYKCADNNFSNNGRETKQDELFEFSIIDILEEELLMKYRVTNIKAHMKEKYSIDASYSIIYSYIKESGLKFGKVQQVHELNLQNKHDRLIHCKKEAQQNQDYILYTDESIFSLRSEVYNNKLESKNLQWKQSSIHVWGGISKQGKTKFYIYQNNLNAEEYQKCLLEAFIPFNESYFSRIILLQDGAKSHTAKSTNKFLSDRIIQKIQNPPYSPDFNAIEIIWAVMKFYFNKLKQNKKQKIKMI